MERTRDVCLAPDCGHRSARFACPLRTKPRPRADEISLILVFHEGVRAIVAAGGFRVPLALVILVLNGFIVTRPGWVQAEDRSA
jgi:hypothetical protein